jgi:hypothetical protein
MIEIEEDGFITVRIGSVTQQIDAYEYWNRVVAIRRECDDSELPMHEFHARVAALLADKFGSVSHFAVDRFAGALADVVDRLGKASAVERTPGSPPPTALQS